MMNVEAYETLRFQIKVFIICFVMFVIKVCFLFLSQSSEFEQQKKRFFAFFVKIHHIFSYKLSGSV